MEFCQASKNSFEVYAKRIFWILFFTCIMSNIALAQQNWKGSIVNEDNLPIENVTIVELDSTSNRMITTILSDSIGQFDISSFKNGNFLYFNHLGYNPQKICFHSGESNFKIKLESDSSFILNEVVVKGEKRIVRLETDRIVYDMSTNPLKKDNLLEAFKFLPLIVSNGESFSMVGKTHLEIYINGRKNTLTGEALISYLKSLPADYIQSIEIITNPNSTYRGEGNFGIVNIQFKKNESEGLKGVFSGQFWKTHYFKERGNFMLNYQTDKFSTNFSTGITNASDWKENIEESIYKYKNLSTLTKTITDGNDQTYFANLITDYKMNDKETIGIIINTSMNKADWSETGNTSILNDINSISNLEYISNEDTHDISVNANYRINFDKPNQYLTVDLDYLNNSSKLRSENRINTIDDNDLSIPQRFEQISPQNISIWSGKIEQGFNLNNHITSKIGLDSYYSKIDNDDKHNVWENNNYVEDAIQSNHFIIKEWTSAVFVSADKEWNEKFSSSLGARLEYTDYKGVQLSLNDDFESKIFKFLPTLYLSYNISDNHKLTYNFSRRISRPPFATLNPFKTYLSPISYSVGNPYLKPEDNLSQNLGYLLYRKYLIQVYYDVTNNVINRLEDIKDNNWIESKPLNIGSSQYFTLLINTSRKYLNGKSHINLTLSYNWHHSKGKAEELELDYINQFLGVNLNNSFLLSEKQNLSFDIGGDYYTKQKESNRDYPSCLTLNLQLRKVFKKWQLSLYGNINEYFYDNKYWTQVWKLSYDIDRLHTNTYMKGEPTSIGIKFLYNFGNSKVKSLEQRDTSNSEVKSRIN